MPAPTSRPAPGSSRDRSADLAAYAALVRDYRRGDSDGPIREIVSWRLGAILSVLSVVEKAAPDATLEVADDTAPNAGAGAVRASFPAAVMLHTEAGLRLFGQRDAEGAGIQWHCARRLAKMPRLPAEGQEFLAAWYRALGLYFLGTYGVRDAVDLLESGRKRFPEDSSMALALGQSYEVLGTFADGQVLAFDSALTPAGRRNLQSAERLYREVLDRDPARPEARLRLGRVLHLQGQSEAAFSEYRRVATDPGGSRLRYLAHLFTADEWRRQSRLPEAREEFTHAVEAWPQGQAAALGLAEVLQTLDEPSEASSVLARTLGAGGEGGGADPFRTYHFGDRAELGQLLEAVRALARRGP